MKLTGWLRIFFGVLLGGTLLFMAYNFILDPFGVFGDRFLNWYEYDMTMSPRVAKIAYLDKHHENYDSYVVGSSKASSLPVAELNDYLDASFYNMTWYGGDLRDECQLVHYLVDHYTVKNLVLAVDPQGAAVYDSEEDVLKDHMHCKLTGESPLVFYGRYLLCNPAYGFDKVRAYLDRGYLVSQDAVYTAETGCYNKQKRDATPIGDMADYLALENNVFPQGYSEMAHVDDALGAIRDIMETCEAHGVSLTILGVPVNNDEFYSYDQAGMTRFWTGLAELTDFYDFWGNNAVNGDIRYFYDTNHFRNDVGRMALAAAFGDESVYVPEGFAHVTTRDTVAGRIAETYGDRTPVPESAYTARVPILMYHSFTHDPGQVSETTMLAETFADHVRALSQAGYQAVGYDDLLAYVRGEADLPENPVVLTFDDGYRNNLEDAAPALEEAGMTGTIAVVGCSVGKDIYKDTGQAMIPHFSLEEAAAWVDRGVLDIQSHSYDMHQVPALDGENCRQGVLRMEGEDEDAYVLALTEDYEKSKAQIEGALPLTCHVFTYPYGLYDLTSEVVLQSLGVDVTVTTRPGVSQVIRGLPQSLYQMKRIDVTGETTAQALLETLAAG